MEQAAVLIGEMPVGPKCAKRAGLLSLPKRKGGLVFRAMRMTAKRPAVNQTLDLFDDAGATS